MIEALLFDKDGTLFLFKETWAGWMRSVLVRLSGQNMDQARRIGADLGFDVDHQRFRPDSIVIAGTPAQIVEALRPHVSHSVDDLERLLNDEAETAEQFEAVSLVPFLTDLRARGLKLGVATNDAERPARAHLEGAGVLDLLDFISGYDSGYGAKPAPGPCLAFANATGVDPARCAMVGDSLHDLHAGRAAGMRTIAVLTGMAGADELAPFADVVLDHIGQIPNWLEQISADAG